jgi:hypothetical protein
VFRNAQVILQFSGAVSEFIIEDLYGLTTNTDLAQALVSISKI